MKKLKLDSIEGALSREQMKRLIGGSGTAASPTDPSGGGTQDIKSRKCCWNDYPDICSTCKDVSANATCVSGASLKDC